MVDATPWKIAISHVLCMYLYYAYNFGTGIAIYIAACMHAFVIIMQSNYIEL